jgi:hypothetical protein
MLLFPTLGMAAAPVNSWAARRAALPAWLRERRTTEYRRDRRAFAAGIATGGAVAVLGVAIAAVALLFTGGHHPVQTPNLVGPAQGSSAPAHGSTPSGSPSSSPSATATSSSPAPAPSSSSPAASPTPTTSSSAPTPSGSPTTTGAAAP